jgi:hypothetical protein
MPIEEPATSFTEHGHYRIRIAGLLDATWARRFEGMAVIPEASDEGRPTTRLEGLVADRAALHGILDRIRDLNLQLLAVQRVERS